MSQSVKRIPCIGAVLWDMVGRHGRAMRLGDDRPGRIERAPGGVALNVASTLRRFAMAPTVLSCIGTDRDGDELMAECARLGVETDLVTRRSDLPTDRYMAIEAMGVLVAAIADASGLETAGASVLAPLHDGRLGSATAPFDGAIVLDGNLPASMLETIAGDPVFRAADLRIVPASPGKAERLRPLLRLENAVFYLNRTEAELLAGDDFASSREAAAALVASGSARVIVTDGEKPTTDACPDDVFDASPPVVEVRRVTGAGDTFMAAHIAAETHGHGRAFALEAAMQAAATHVTGQTAEARG